MNNNFCLFFIMFIGAHSECMEQGLVWTEEAVQTILIPYLTIQSLSSFARTCTLYAKSFDPAKIQIYKPCFDKIEQNYYRATHALSRLALQENKKIFDRLWLFDCSTRKKNREKLHGELACNFSDNMNIYRTYYKNPEEVDKRISDQLVDAIMDKDRDVIDIITSDKQYNIFELFKDDTIENAIQHLCQMYCGDSDYLLKLLPVESGEHKNRAVQYICKYDDMNILCGEHKNRAVQYICKYDDMNILCSLLIKNYLKIDEEYGYKCTLLHYAALRGLNKLIIALRDKGASLHVVNMWGKEPLDYVYKFKEEHGSMYQGPYAKFEGIWIDWCKNECGEKHKCESKEYVSQKVSQEEVNWLHRSCTYVTDNLYICIKKVSTPVPYVINKKATQL